MNFVVFIISHERADRVETYDTLKRGGYTGQIFIVIDNEDSMLRTYLDRFGDEVLIFDKQHYIEQTDTLETSKLKASAVYARNAVEDFARLFEVDTFAMLDDDLTRFRFRWLENKKLKSLDVESNLDIIFEQYSKFIVDGNIADVAFATVMLYCGGAEYLNERVCSARQCYGFHIRNVKLTIDWISIINEDLITEQTLGKTGYIFLTLPFILYETKKLNTLPGGVKSLYDTLSSYKRAFLATISLPSSCRPIYSNDDIAIRLSRKNLFPMIISGRYKK